MPAIFAMLQSPRRSPVARLARCSVGVERLVVAGGGVGTALAEDLDEIVSWAVGGALDLAVIVDAFTAAGADDAGGFVAGHLAGMQGDADPLLGEEVGVGQFAVGEHLLLVLVFDVGIEVAGPLFGGLAGGDADGAVGGEIDEGGGHLAPIAELEGTFAEAATGNDGNGVSGATIDLDEGDEALAVGAFGVFDAEAGATEHGQADAEDLSGAEVAVGDLCFAQ
jgi:hypothetical protein